jgi:hypothetical protein
MEKQKEYDPFINNFGHSKACQCDKCKEYWGKERELAAKIITQEMPKESFSAPKKNYSLLENVLAHAVQQASTGKGKERHANDNNYEDQLICVVGRLLRGHPYGSHAYQVIKKTIEAGRLYYIKGPKAAYAEVLGAINYAAAMNILISEDTEQTNVEET